MSDCGCRYVRNGESDGAAVTCRRRAYARHLCGGRIVLFAVEDARCRFDDQFVKAFDRVGDQLGDRAYRTGEDLVKAEVRKREHDKQNEHVGQQQHVLQPEGVRRAVVEHESPVRRDEGIVAVQQVDAEGASRKRRDRLCAFGACRRGSHGDEDHAERDRRSEHERIVVAVHVPCPFAVAGRGGDRRRRHVVEQGENDIHDRPERRLAFQPEFLQRDEPAVNVYRKSPKGRVALFRADELAEEIPDEPDEAEEYETDHSEVVRSLSAEPFRKFVEERCEYADRDIYEYEPIFCRGGETFKHRVDGGVESRHTREISYELAHTKIDVYFDDEREDLGELEADGEVAGDEEENVDAYDDETVYEFRDEHRRQRALRHYSFGNERECHPVDAEVVDGEMIDDDEKDGEYPQQVEIDVAFPRF